MLGDLLGAGLLHGQPADAGLLQIDQDGSGDLRALGAGARGGRAAVGALHVPVPLVDEVQEALHRAEDVTAVGEADEGLGRLDAVPLDAGLDQVIAPGQGNVVQQLEAGVVVLHGDEEGHAEAVAVLEVHGRVREGPPGRGVDRAPVRARAILAGELEAQLVGRARRQQRDQAAVEGVGPVPLHGIGAPRPGVDVEGAVQLLGPGVVVLEGGGVAVREVPVDLGEEGAGVVGAVDGAVVAGQGPVEGGVHEAAQPGVDAFGVVLPGVAQDLLVVGGEEEGPVPSSGVRRG